MDGKLTLKGEWSGHGNHLNFVSTNHTSGTAKARVVKFCMQVGYVKSQCNDDKSPLKGAWSRLSDQWRSQHFQLGGGATAV